MCSFTVLGGSENQSVSGVTTICHLHRKSLRSLSSAHEKWGQKSIAENEYITIMMYVEVFVDNKLENILPCAIKDYLLNTVNVNEADQSGLNYIFFYYSEDSNAL